MRIFLDSNILVYLIDKEDSTKKKNRKEYNKSGAIHQHTGSGGERKCLLKKVSAR